MGLPNLQITRFCSQNRDIHENLGGQGLGTEKIKISSKKVRWPNLHFCSQNCEIHGNLGGQEPGTKKNNLNIFYLKKCACPTSKKLDFAAKIVKFMEIWEVRSRDEKNNLNIFYLKKCACPTSKKLDFAAKIGKFMEIWEVRSRGRKKTI